MPTVTGMAQMTVGRRPAPRWGFGDRLRLVRRDLGLTQAEMAIRVGVGLKAYSAWESGASRPADPPKTAEHLEAVTGIDRTWWLGWGEGAPPPTDGLPRLDSNQQPAGYSADWPELDPLDPLEALYLADVA